MARPLQIKRRTDTVLAGITLLAGELGFATDSKRLYAGDGTNNNPIGGPGALDLADAADVVITGITDDEILQWDHPSLQWINRTLAEAGIADTSHAAAHITGAADEFDADKADIDWNPTNYTPATTPAQVTSVDHLTAHLYGIDQEFNLVGYLAGANTWTGNNIIDGANFEHRPGVGDVFKAGMGQDGAITLVANFDQTGIHFLRHLHGDGSYTEAGSVVVIQRDVTGMTDGGGSGSGNMLEFQDASDDLLARFDKNGNPYVYQDATHYWYVTVSGNTATIRASASDMAYRANKHLMKTGAGGAGTLEVGTIEGKDGTSLTVRSNKGDAFNLTTVQPTGDEAPGLISLIGGTANASATTNKVGGNVEVYGGTGDGAGGQTGAHGGDLNLYGGAAASDLASSNGGNVLIYPGQHGSSGNEGTVSLRNADGTTKVIEKGESTIGVFQATPVGQQAHIADADGQLADITAKFNTLLSYLETGTGFGWLADA